MNYEIYWSKTLLGVYRYLPRMADAFDRVVETRAYNSMTSSSYNVVFNDITNVASSIIELTERKVSLVNAKIIVDKVLSKLKIKSSKILVLKFIDGRKMNDIIKLLGVSKRTYFRRIRNAINDFAEKLIELGFCSKRLFLMLKNERWIISVFESYSRKNVEITENILESFAFRNKLQRNISNELRRVKVC